MTDLWINFTPLERIFTVIAVPFTVLTLLQLILEIVGLGSDHDAGNGGMDHSHDAGFGHDGGGFLADFSVFTVRNLIYFMMMFGWSGIACSKIGLPAIVSIPAATLSGVLTTIIIGWIFYSLHKLTESGNVQLTNAVGKMATVYLSIPEKRQGSGVIQVVIQGATQELNAVTDGERLPTGKSVRVIEILDDNSALVIGADQLGADL